MLPGAPWAVAMAMVKNVCIEGYKTLRRERREIDKRIGSSYIEVPPVQCDSSNNPRAVVRPRPCSPVPNHVAQLAIPSYRPILSVQPDVPNIAFVSVDALRRDRGPR